MSLLDKIATLEEKIPRLVEALESARRDLREAHAERERGRHQPPPKKADAGQASEFHQKLATLEKSLSETEKKSSKLQAQLETEQGARTKAEAALAEALSRLDTLVQRLEGLESELAALEEQSHGGQ